MLHPQQIFVNDNPQILHGECRFDNCLPHSNPRFRLYPGLPPNSRRPKDRSRILVSGRIMMNWSSVYACTFNWTPSNFLSTWSISWNQSFMISRQRIGPKHDPCGHPLEVSMIISSDVTFLPSRKKNLKRIS